MKLSALPNATALTGAEILALVQAGQTSKTTAADMAAFASQQHRAETVPHPQYEVTTDLRALYESAKNA